MTALALFGGTPVVGPAEFETRWPIVTDEDVATLVGVMRQGAFTALSRGEEHVASLEREFAAYTGTRFGVAVANGTAALHLALAASGIGRGDEVIVPALSFVASAMAVLHAGAVPIFADIDPVTFNIDPARVAERVTPRTRAIMAVHLHGLPADMDALGAIAARHGLVLIEDAAQAHGARHRGRRTGALGDIAATSFNVSKNLPASGEGGLITTDKAEWAERAAMLRQFGERISPDEPRRYVSHALGWNYKLNVLQAAFVRRRLATLDADTIARQQNCGRLADALAELPGLLPPAVPPECTHAWHFFRFRLDPVAAGIDATAGQFRRAVARVLQAEGVLVGQYQSLPLPAHPVFQDGRALAALGVPAEARERYRQEDHPVTRQVLGDSLTLQRGLLRPDAGRLAEAYADAFRKVWGRLDEVERYARGLAPRALAAAGGAR
jgi:dTDP-4-amino-4,6-dideoxygalactose transaminase